METKLYHCPSCGYRVNAIGGTDRDGEVRCKTMVCPTCHAVVDAVVARLVPGETEFGIPIDRWHSVPARCPHCDGGALTPWPLDRPCPRCGGEMDS
ncbi:hypothetical protein GF314_07160 [bacterium]|nr:hypothetical protein [bacterium]